MTEPSHMFCTRCGARVEDGAAFCQDCGNPLRAVGPAPPARQQSYLPHYKPLYGAQTQALPLNWHKFLIYFSLWAAGIVNILSGIAHATGLVYEVQISSALVYRLYPMMKPCDLLFGALIFMYGLSAIFVRFQLAGFRRNAPKLLVGLYALSAVVATLHTIVTSIIIRDLSVLPAQAVLTVAGIVKIVLNYIYYQKREALFCN